MTLLVGARRIASWQGSPIMILEVTVEELGCVRRDQEVHRDVIPYSDFLG